ncbi:MAG: T9SS type A sorting domain-containing protein [Bacteroidales bacterium]|nr:T9SS type A sorting domain-containing protein [Bacteroidales bacterium]
MKQTFNLWIKTLCVILSLTAIFAPASAQEVLTGLRVNKAVAREAAKQTTAEPTRTEAIRLPFVDDFSNYTGFPKASLWQDRYAFVNQTFAIQPPSIGVATLDALDENGNVYAHADGAGFQADHLTSLPIRLDYNFPLNREMRVADSLYFSFYYQPAGGSLSGLEWERLGNRPEGRDSLILEFGYATGDTVFIGYEYCDYYLGEGESYVIGDTLFNPFMPNDFYIFDHAAFPGDLISLPCNELFGPEMYWEHIWSAPGEVLDNWIAENPLEYFKQVMIPITDPRWFVNNFQFRFRNMASLEDNAIVGWASNVDQWNIDYVRLDVNRSQNDLYPNDLAFVMPTTSILNKYQSMPWSQYRDSDLKRSFVNKMSNLSHNVKNSYYTYKIQKVGGGQIATYTPNNENAEPYYDHGLHTAAQHVNPPVEVTSLPTDNSDSATFIITHIFQEVGTGDDRRCNDTCIFEQKFNNYYAYDDGTAEAGYSVLSTMTIPEAYFAMRFTLAQPDTLRAVRMWFNSVLEDANFQEFTLMVWDDNGNRPGTVLYEQQHQLPAHADNFADFVTYRLDNPVAIEGTFYVGFFQNHSAQLNLGFDQNTDSREHFLYMTANEWREPFLLGTPMVRPVVGAPIPVPVNVVSTENTGIQVYPNPATTTLTVVLPEHHTVGFYRIFDAFGKMVDSRRTSENSLNISGLTPGLYILQLTDNEGKTFTQKFVKE